MMSGCSGSGVIGRCLPIVSLYSYMVAKGLSYSPN